MAGLHALANAQSSAWKERVALVPISIDADPERVRSHIAQRSWTGMEHFWSGDGKGRDFDAPAARAFVINSVPQSILIGRDGRILWRGHPLDDRDGIDLKKRIEQALEQP
jgi:hypothetical protein